MTRSSLEDQTGKNLVIRNQVKAIKNATKIRVETKSMKEKRLEDQVKLLTDQLLNKGKNSVPSTGDSQPLVSSPILFGPIARILAPGISKTMTTHVV